jgi:hypothetical protein
MTEQPQGEAYTQHPPHEQLDKAASPITLATAVTRSKGVEMPGQCFEIDRTTWPITAGDLGCH